MDVVGLLITVLVLAIVFWLATWIIQRSLPADVQKIALVIVGVIALLVLLGVVSGYIPHPRFNYR